MLYHLQKTYCDEELGFNTALQLNFFQGFIGRGREDTVGQQEKRPLRGGGKFGGCETQWLACQENVALGIGLSRTRGQVFVISGFPRGRNLRSSPNQRLPGTDGVPDVEPGRGRAPRVTQTTVSKVPPGFKAGFGEGCNT